VLYGGYRLQGRKEDTVKSYRVVAFKRGLQASEVPTPEPHGTQVLLRVIGTGVCRSDLHIWDGGFDVGHGERVSLSDSEIPLPLTLGHETVGEVAAIGQQAIGVERGEIRLVYPWTGCGQCPACLAGHENLCRYPRYLGVYCDGGYSDYVLVPHPRYLLDIGGLDPITAVPYVCSGLAAYCALRKVIDVVEREPILIIGAGSLGLMALNLLNAMEGKGAFVVDIDERNRMAALKAGALATIDGTAQAADRKVTQYAGGPVRAALDLVGSSQSSTLAFDCLIEGGRLIVVGLFGGKSPWALPRISAKAITIQGSYLGSLAELKELLDLVRRHSIPPIPVSTRPLDEANEALADLRYGKVMGRMVLTPRGTPT
jgi:alcohol dehydrogenase, propanol-preferring